MGSPPRRGSSKGGASLIHRLKVKDGEDLRPQWPSNPDRSAEIYQGRHPLRRLKVMVDADLVDQPAQPGRIGEQAMLLGELLRHPLIRSQRYRDDGPPPHVIPDPAVTRVKVYEGWAVASDRNSQGCGVIYRDNGEQYTLSAVTGNTPEVAANDTKTPAYLTLGARTAADRRRSDALAASVADEAVEADLYVTDREYLLKATWSIAQRTTICSTDQALTAIGLYLRTQGEFVIGDSLRYNRGLFFWVGTRQILDEAWRWFSGCVQHSMGAGDDGLMNLAGSLLQRVDRALEARDGVHVALNRPQNNDVREDALSGLDHVALLLMGALDVAARVAHRALLLPANSEHTAGWQKVGKGQWLERVRAACAPLASVVDAGTDAQCALTIVRCLRNSVHGAALQGIHVVTGQGPAETLVGLPISDEIALLNAMDALGGREHWGVRVLYPGRTHIDPGIAVDRLFEAVVPLLNALMNRTPVEQLTGVVLTDQDLFAPSAADGPFDETARLRIQALLGL